MTSSGGSCAHASSNPTAAFVDGSLNASLPTIATVPCTAWSESAERSAA
jgi:hypothetical protein